MILNIRAWHQLPRPRAIVMCNEQGEATAQTYNPVVNKNRLWNAPAATRTTFRFSGSMIVGVQRGSLSPKPSCTRHRGNAEQSLQLADTWALGTTLPSLPRELHTCPRRPQPQVYTVPASLNAMECSSPVTTCRMRMGLDGPREMTACNHAKATETLIQPQSCEPTKTAETTQFTSASSSKQPYLVPLRTEAPDTSQAHDAANSQSKRQHTSAIHERPRLSTRSPHASRSTYINDAGPTLASHDTVAALAPARSHHTIPVAQRPVTNSNRGDTCTSGSACRTDHPIPTCTPVQTRSTRHSARSRSQAPRAACRPSTAHSPVPQTAGRSRAGTRRCCQTRCRRPRAAQRPQSVAGTCTTTVSKPQKLGTRWIYVCRCECECATRMCDILFSKWSHLELVLRRLPRR